MRYFCRAFFRLLSPAPYPAASSERDEQSDRVGEALGLGQNPGIRGAEIGALRVDDLKLRHAAESEPQANMVEIFLRGSLGDATVSFMDRASDCSARSASATF